MTPERARRYELRSLIRLTFTLPRLDGGRVCDVEQYNHSLQPWTRTKVYRAKFDQFALNVPFLRTHSTHTRSPFALIAAHITQRRTPMRRQGI